MAIDTAALEQELKDKRKLEKKLKKELEKKARQLQANRDLDYGITEHNDEFIRNALANGAEVDTCVVYEDGEIDNRAPLIKAVLVQNVYAVNQLLLKQANPNILDFDVPLLERAIEKGNTHIVTALLTAKCDVNSYGRRSGLAVTITEMAANALINQSDSIWDNDATERKLQKELQSWFINPSQKAPDTPLPLKVKFFGDLKMINLLLIHGINASRANIQGITPEMIIQNPQNYIKKFTITTKNPNENVTYLSCEGKTLSFQKVLSDEKLTKRLPIIVEYDFSKIEAILKEHFELKAQSTGVSQKFVERRIEEAEKKAAAELATTNAMMTPMLGKYQKAEMQQNQIDSLHTKISVPELNPENPEGINPQGENPEGINPKGAFYDTFTRELNNILLGFKVLASGAVQRTKNTTLDKFSGVINMLGDHVPFGGAAKLIAGLIEAVSDHKEAKRHKRVMSVIDLDHIPLCKKLSLEIINDPTIGIASELALLTPENAENMAKKAIAIVLSRMNDESFKPETSPIEKQLSTIVNTSPYFKTELGRYQLEQEVVKKLQLNEQDVLKKPLLKGIKGMSRLCRVFS